MLSEFLVTDNGTDFTNNEIFTLCDLYYFKHEPKKSHAQWTNGLSGGMNRSLQEFFRSINNGNDKNHNDWSLDVNLFPLTYNSQIATTFGLHHMKWFLSKNHENQ